MTLKNQILYFLEQQDITASQLSRKAKVPKSNISEWLTGRKPKDFEQVKRVADALGTTLDNLCFGKGADKNIKSQSLDDMVEGEWLSGKFEIKIRRIK